MPQVPRKRSRPVAEIQSTMALATKRIETAREAVELLHRETDELIAFSPGVDADHGFWLRAIPNTLDTLPERMASHRMVDSCSVNQFGIDKRRNRWLFRLCAVFVRIPHRRKDTRELVAARILEGVVPHPSVVVTAPRNVTLLWLLRDTTRPELPPQSHAGTSKADTLNLYRTLQDAYADRLASCGAERETADASNVVRLPSDRVTWEASDPPRVFTIAELFDAIRVKEPKRGRRRRAAPKERKPPSEKRQTNRRQILERRLCMVQRLAELRGGIGGRHRKHAVRLIAACMDGLRMPQETITAELDRARTELCRPALEGGAFMKAVTLDPGLLKLTDQRIIEQLGITAREAKILGLPKPARNKTASDFEPKPTKNEAKVARRDAVYRAILAKNGGRMPSRPELQAELRRSRIPVSLPTISRDLARLRRLLP